MRIITLLTDFGHQDTYVAEMKGVILGIAPEVRLVDLCHEVPPQNLAAGAYLLRRAIGAFPPNTIHLAVVDPEVGSARRPILISVGNTLFVGPDNGLLMEAASSLEGEAHAYLLENPALRRHPVSAVFHGRDIFAPAAAHLALGVPPAAFGPPLDDPVWLTKPPLRASPQEVTGEVLWIDRFGNLVTSIPEKALPQKEDKDLLIEIGGTTISGIRRAYSEVSPGDLLALIGSAGLLEIAVFCGSAEERLKGTPGMTVRVRKP